MSLIQAFCHLKIRIVNNGTIVPLLCLLLERSFQIKIMNAINHVKTIK